MNKNIKIRKPIKDDAKSIFNLVKGTQVLDVNSEYLYLLQATHFQDTCSVAEADGAIVGFASGYMHPDEANTLFVWQVGVDENFRGQALAQRLIKNILERNSQVEYIHTTISPSNTSSQRLFEKLTSELHTNIKSETMFEVSDFNDAHESEVLYKVGPFNHNL